MPPDIADGRRMHKRLGAGHFTGRNIKFPQMPILRAAPEIPPLLFLRRARAETHCRHFRVLPPTLQPRFLQVYRTDRVIRQLGIVNSYMMCARAYVSAMNSKSRNMVAFLDTNVGDERRWATVGFRHIRVLVQHSFCLGGQVGNRSRLFRLIIFV